jgi:Na+-translocating ferredoxin:NAD+ oxidoreductase RnfG subunit
MNQQEQATAGARLIRGVTVLALICLGSGLGVGLLYSTMKDDIEANERSVFENTLAEVLGEAERYATLGEYGDDVPMEERIYVRETDRGVLYAAIGRAQGYQSQVKVLVSVRADRPGQPVGDDPVIQRMAVVSSQETPGLGENINAVEKDVSLWGAVAGDRGNPGRPWFQEQFSGKRLSDLVVEKREETPGIAALTGATITSEAATKASRKAVRRIISRTQELYGQ